MNDTRTRQDRFLHDDREVTLQIRTKDWLDVLKWLIPTDAILAVEPGKNYGYLSVAFRLPALVWWRNLDQIHPQGG